MLTRIQVRNFKGLEDVTIELGQTAVFVGPNNSGKTTALQALALWDIGLRKWLEKRSAKGAPEKRPGVTINRRDLIAVPVPEAKLLWHDVHVRSQSRGNGKPATQNICIEILVSGVTNGEEWECGLEFDFANQESFYCRPLRSSKGEGGERMRVPEMASALRVAYLPPMSGLAATEDRLEEGSVNVRIGEGRTAEVLRNLCHRIAESNDGQWPALVEHIRKLFGVALNQPEFQKERGQIVMSYREASGVDLDLSSSGRGLQQTLLLLAYLFSNPESVLLLDEPDAHLEILRQRQIYELLTRVAREQKSQIVAATHSEVLLNEAADRDVVIAFVGRPHRMNDKGSQVVKSLRSIGFEQYYQAEQTGWVLYVEGSTDLAILRAFAELLDHSAGQVLQRPFVWYPGNVPAKAREHFFGLREAKKDLVGIALFDAVDETLQASGPLHETAWRAREIENYLCFEETLLAYAEATVDDLGPLFAESARERQAAAMRNAIDEVTGALRTLGKPDPFGPQIKASDEVLTPIFAKYFARLGLRNLMQKTDFHVLARYVPRERLSPEIGQKLDLIVAVAGEAKPTV